ncbi:succinate dehydrogenase assembly factor 3, mitochondrial [Wyeomyia smithii]|uniref:succinate dehydrogenase assembly factor 3, mitochondrial n=1 Tax=Wyeomyia smithii TaxID=174621 RepID=UPI002467D42A|nr:succinate dehydrogenase assembly factor 3, mitochondrial [Wyeomyia smithii]
MTAVTKRKIRASCSVLDSYYLVRKDKTTSVCSKLVFLMHINRVRMLYKTILKLHRGLPAELHLLGDQYVKDEFRRHKSCSVEEANLFMKEWTDYAVTLANQLHFKGKPTPIEYLGKNLDISNLDNFNEQQISQLYELLLASTGVNNNLK